MSVVISQIIGIKPRNDTETWAAIRDTIAKSVRKNETFQLLIGYGPCQDWHLCHIAEQTPFGANLNVRKLIKKNGPFENAFLYLEADDEAAYLRVLRDNKLKINWNGDKIIDACPSDDADGLESAKRCAWRNILSHFPDLEQLLTNEKECPAGVLNHIAEVANRRLKSYWLTGVRPSGVDPIQEVTLAFMDEAEIRITETSLLDDPEAKFEMCETED
jgi:hypothetical protein